MRLCVRAVRAAHLHCCYCCRESIRACIFQLARDRCLASGFGHAMGFDSPAGLPGFEPSGPLSDLPIDLCSPRLLDPVSALSDAYRATAVSDFAFGRNFMSCNDWGLWRIFSPSSTILFTRPRCEGDGVSDGGRVSVCGSECGVARGPGTPVVVHIPVTQCMRTFDIVSRRGHGKL